MAQVTSAENPQGTENKFQGYRCKSALPSFDGVPLEITLTVPLTEHSSNNVIFIN